MPFGKVPRSFSNECYEKGYRKEKKFEQKVKKIVKKTTKVEMKHIINDFPVTMPFVDQPANIASVIRQMFPIDRGNAVNQRDGNRLLYKSLSWRYTIQNVDPGTQGQPGTARVMIVMDKKSNKVSLADEPNNLNIPRAGGGLARNFTHANIRTPEYMARYQVLHDKTYDIGGFKTDHNNERVRVHTSGYKKLNFNVQYADGPAAGTFNNMISGPIYLILWYECTNVGPPQVGANFSMQAKLQFVDV